MNTLICLRCKSEFSNKLVNLSLINKNPDRFKICKECRNFKKCEVCESEFNNYQNRTCSKSCSKKLKEMTHLKNYGATHNFDRNSLSRKEWESKLLIDEGIMNVFQRESVKEKIKETWTSKYGVDNPSKSEDIKLKKLETLAKTLEIRPNLYKDNWKIQHIKFMEDLGYDPRLHAIGKASNESLLVFKPLLDWCLSIGIEEDDIYLGIEEKQEFFLQTKKKLYFYDFCIRSKKIIIEFHGTAFHAKSEDQIWKHPFINQNAKENIRNTKVKNNKAIKNGFNLLEIWSDESIESNIEKCKTFIN
jgi:hypothetical protein